MVAIFALYTLQFVISTVSRAGNSRDPVGASRICITSSRIKAGTNKMPGFNECRLCNMSICTARKKLHQSSVTNAAVSAPYSQRHRNAYRAGLSQNNEALEGLKTVHLLLPVSNLLHPEMLPLYSL